MGFWIFLLIFIGFIGALLFWASILQSLVSTTVTYWKKSGFWKRLLMSSVTLLGLSIALGSLSMFNKQFLLFVERYFS